MRADKFLAENNYFDSRSKARIAIEAGLVFADGRAIQKPSEDINETSTIVASAPYPWVSRAGLKLEYALGQFHVDATDRICLDVGASTGGFTQVLCANGASLVYSVDVGTDQLHRDVRSDPRVLSMEQMDARNLTPAHFEHPPNLVVCDVSFISCMKALDTALDLTTSQAELITLVKPQFEVGRENIGKGGIVQDQDMALKSVNRVRDWLRGKNWSVKGQDISPIKGGSGNTEYLLHAVRR